MFKKLFIKQTNNNNMCQIIILYNFARKNRIFTKIIITNFLRNIAFKLRNTPFPKK